MKKFAVAATLISLFCTFLFGCAHSGKSFSNDSYSSDPSGVEAAYFQALKELNEWKDGWRTIGPDPAITSPFLHVLDDVYSIAASGDQVAFREACKGKYVVILPAGTEVYAVQDYDYAYYVNSNVIKVRVRGSTVDLWMYKSYLEGTKE